MIRTFGDAATAALFNRSNATRARRFPPDIVRAAQRKLDMIHSAAVLGDLRVPPANRLEALAGDLRGFYSIRVNDQWRVIFRWVDGAAEDVAVVDYH